MYTDDLNLHMAKAAFLLGVLFFGVTLPRKGFAMVYSIICSLVSSNFRELPLWFEYKMTPTDSRTLALQLVGSSGETLRGGASQEEVGPRGQQGLRAGAPSASCLLAKSPPLSEQSWFRSQADIADSSLQGASHSSHQAFSYQDGLCPLLQVLLNILPIQSIPLLYLQKFFVSS